MRLGDDARWTPVGDIEHADGIESACPRCFEEHAESPHRILLHQFDARLRPEPMTRRGTSFHNLHMRADASCMTSIRTCKPRFAIADGWVVLAE